MSSLSYISDRTFSVDERRKLAKEKLDLAREAMRQSEAKEIDRIPMAALRKANEYRKLEVDVRTAKDDASKAESQEQLEAFRRNLIDASNANLRNSPNYEERYRARQSAIEALRLINERNP